MLNYRVLFRGQSTVHQLQLIFALLGTPSDEAILRIPNEKCQHFIRDMQPQEAKPLSQAFPTAGADDIDLLSGLLEFDPSRRLRVDEAIAHAAMSDLYTPDDEPVRSPLVTSDFEFERRKITEEAMREELFLEALEYHPEREKFMAEYTYNIFDFRLLEPGESQFEGIDQAKADFSQPLPTSRNTSKERTGSKGTIVSISRNNSKERMSPGSKGTNASVAKETQEKIGSKEKVPQLSTGDHERKDAANSILSHCDESIPCEQHDTNELPGVVSERTPVDFSVPSSCSERQYTVIEL
eukprot:gnl/MRDRNA2_/MRDRNA2_173236_c0_seq1.p1 gnl/MRDRNA2_/MRDRNA2_173236_c0~~gnl/MRDRNA2_/MRDRNA2_173236_c0_seq1.p1  ORF type:complete len:331 (+),score=50.84 gnl/MRDRNA2_/MRDRNA2_173236_c0_seq1:106-993(+)